MGEDRDFRSARHQTLEVLGLPLIRCFNCKRASLPNPDNSTLVKTAIPF